MASRIPPEGTTDRRRDARLPPAPPGRGRLLAIDPSLTCSGWALFGLPGGTLLGFGSLKSLGPAHDLAYRLAELQCRIVRLLERCGLAPDDVLVCEAPTTMRDPDAALKVEQVRCVFETLARSIGVQVPGRVNPRSVHHEILGMRGVQLARDVVKDAAARSVATLYGPRLRELGFDPCPDRLRRHQDVVDAVLIGALAVSRVTTAARAGVPLASQFRTGRVPRRGVRLAGVAT